MYKKVISVVFCMFLIVAGMGPVYAKTTADAARLEVENAWKYGKGDGVNVALIDCGADLKDPMIRANVKGVYSSLIDSEKESDVHSAAAEHGTNCAKKILEAAPSVNLYIVKAGDHNGAYMKDIIAGLYWAKSKNCRVVSYSMGSESFDQKGYDAIQELFCDSFNSVLVCASAGNSGIGEHHYPASFDNTLSVGAATYHSSKNQFVVIPKGTYNNKIDVVAPGAITSHAAPFAAGTAALLFQANPSMTAEECRRILRSTALDLGVKGKDFYYGYGLIQPYAAVKKVLNIDSDSVKKLTLSKKKLTLYIGQSKKIMCTKVPSKSRGRVYWNSSSPSTVSVTSEGKLTAKRAGNAVITVKTVNGRKVVCKVNVCR